MRDLTQEEDAAIGQSVPYPPPETGLSLRGVYTADGGVRPSGFDLDSTKNDPEGPLDSAG